MVLTRGTQTGLRSDVAQPALSESPNLITPDMHHSPTRKRRRSPSPPDYRSYPHKNLQHGAEAQGRMTSRGGTTSASYTSSHTEPSCHDIVAESNFSMQSYSGQHPKQAFNMSGPPEAANTSSHTESVHLRVQSLPVLDNLATQILSIIARSSYQEVITMATKRDSNAGQAFLSLKELFRHAKKVYSQTDPFLNARALGLADNIHIETIRKANLATFMISVLGSQDVGFYHLNEWFLDSFIPEDNELLRTQGELFLELKTQAYISAISNGERSREEILEDLFPFNLEQRLLSRKSVGKQLTDSELDLVRRARHRRDALLREPNTEAAVRALPEKYVWANFLKDVSTYISKNFNVMAGELPPKPPRYERSAEDLNIKHPGNDIPLSRDDFVTKAQRAAQLAIEDFAANKAHSASAQQPQAPPAGNAISSSKPQGPEIQFHFENQLHPNVPGPQIPYFNTLDQNGNWTSPAPDSAHIPTPAQSAPTSVLYERARMAASPKASQSNREPGGPSQRRAWTLEEENALMAGLDRVKGPHWSQILVMFGQNGTISQVLKNRGQVQLKDKARNLKLFFLKNNIEVPYYLQFVTGEMKTRAPKAAAKREAQGRRNSAEDRAHVEACMALATGPQQRDEVSIGGSGAGNWDDETNGSHTDNRNLDPTLAGLQQNSLSAARSFNADFIAPLSRAPNADMTTGRRQSQSAETSS